MKLCASFFRVLACAVLLASCGYTGPPKPIPDYLLSGDCKKIWGHVHGMEDWEGGRLLHPRAWLPGGANANKLPDYILYRNNILHSWVGLGDVYYSGCPAAGVRQDKMKAALEMYQAAALHHVPSGQFKFGRMLYEGDGLPRDTEKGLAWLTSAALEGSSEARAFLSSLGETAPSAVQPASYDVNMEIARRRLEQAQNEARQQVWHDIGEAASTVAQVIVYGAVLAAGAPVQAPNSVSARRARPVFCTTTAQASEQWGVIAARAQTFCN